MEIRSHRSIPACAGEPALNSVLLMSPTVYPRVCGGTYTTMDGEVSAGGLSPRVRGNQEVDLLPSERFGSIPACAGEPIDTALYDAIVAVYPRVCGGT